MKKEKFTIKDFNSKYPDDDACLEELFRSKHGEKLNCPTCSKEAKFYKIKQRKSYACEHCAYQIHPLANTIFHKSSTSLKNWFFAIFLFASSKNGVAAKELERQLGVTYKTAWRMAKQIRLLFQQNKTPLSNIDIFRHSQTNLKNSLKKLTNFFIWRPNSRLFKGSQVYNSLILYCNAKVLGLVLVRFSLIFSFCFGNNFTCFFCVKIFNSLSFEMGEAFF